MNITVTTVEQRLIGLFDAYFVGKICAKVALGMKNHQQAITEGIFTVRSVGALVNLTEIKLKR